MISSDLKFRPNLPSSPTSKAESYLSLKFIAENTIIQTSFDASNTLIFPPMRVSVLLICLTLAGCAGGPSSDMESDNPLTSHERIWDEADIENYEYTFQQQCFCVQDQVQPVTIEVRDGRIERVTSNTSGQNLTGDASLRWYTVSELFMLIEEAEANNQDPLIVRYDQELGYPTHIEIGSLAADAGVIYSATELHPL